MTPEVLRGVDLQRDPSARRAVKDEVVRVVFAHEAGAVTSEVGPNRYAAGDALVTGSTGDTWTVSRATFDAKYLPLDGAHGEPGRYRNRPSPVLARRMDAPFSVERRPGGDVLHGAAGDWLVQYAPRDLGIVAAARFAAVYRLLE